MTRASLSLVLLLCATLSSCTFLPTAARDIEQAIWVTRFDYKTESDVREIVRNCARAGLDTVLFQVRGNGTVGYASSIEPWFEQFGFRSPGFDPLAVACDEARQQGIDLHAWVNAVPGWRGATAPSYEFQLYNTHPDWFVIDQYHERQKLSADRYVHLNVCLPEVRDHIARICEEITRKYPVDGIHLDYIRFDDPATATGGKSASDYPYDNRSLEYYREATGKIPDDDRASWDQWRMDCVTELVRDVKRRVDRVRRRAVVSAAVYATPELARGVLQDWPRWLEQGYVDAVFPMTYDDDDARFRARLAAQKAVATGPVIVGLGVYKHDTTSQTLRQMREVRDAGFQGYALFAYASFFASNATGAGAPVEASMRSKRRDTILPALQGGRLLQR